MEGGIIARLGRLFGRRGGGEAGSGGEREAAASAGAGDPAPGGPAGGGASLEDLETLAAYFGKGFSERTGEGRLDARPMPHLLDTTGLCCPIPVLLTLRELTRLDPGERLTVVGDDPAMAEDIPALCDLHSHRILERGEEGESLSFVIEKAEEG